MQYQIADLALLAAATRVDRAGEYFFLLRRGVERDAVPLDPATGNSVLASSENAFIKNDPNDNDCDGTADQDDVCDCAEAPPKPGLPFTDRVCLKGGWFWMGMGLTDPDAHENAYFASPIHRVFVGRVEALTPMADRLTPSAARGRHPPTDIRSRGPQPQPRPRPLRPMPATLLEFGFPPKINAARVISCRR